MTNVVTLSGNPVHGPTDPDTLVIEELEKLLEAAKSGEIIGFLIAVEHADASVHSQHVGLATQRTLGCLHCLAHRIAGRLNE